MLSRSFEKKAFDKQGILRRRREGVETFPKSDEWLIEEVSEAVVNKCLGLEALLNIEEHAIKMQMSDILRKNLYDGSDLLDIVTQNIYRRDVVEQARETVMYPRNHYMAILNLKPEYRKPHFSYSNAMHVLEALDNIRRYYANLMKQPDKSEIPYLFRFIEGKGYETRKIPTP